MNLHFVTCRMTYYIMVGQDTHVMGSTQFLKVYAVVESSTQFGIRHKVDLRTTYLTLILRLWSGL